MTPLSKINLCGYDQLTTPDEVENDPKIGLRQRPN